MENINDKLITWANSNGYWAQSMLQSCFVNGEINTDKLKEIFECYKNQTFEDINLTVKNTNITHKTFLKSIKNIKNVNKLLDNQELSFNNNLTVVYGSNGTGKTGYVRIIKSMGNSLDEENSIYSDLTEEEKENHTAEIQFYNGVNDEDFSWENINFIADYKKAVGDSSTDFFLDVIFHEFAHAIHFDHLSKILNKNDYLRLLVKLEEMDKNGSFKKKYLKTISKESCIYAGTNPMESVACDLSKRILSSLDEYKLRPLENFTENSPYREHCFEETFLSKIFDKKYDRLIRRFWNGNIK